MSGSARSRLFAAQMGILEGLRLEDQGMSWGVLARTGGAGGRRVTPGDTERELSQPSARCPSLSFSCSPVLPLLFLSRGYFAKTSNYKRVIRTQPRVLTAPADVLEQAA